MNKNSRSPLKSPGMAAMEGISLLYGQGLSSNLRDRVCTYQWVLGVSIANNLNISSEKNEGFMKSFNKLIGYMLEFYKAKQLAVAIQSAGNTGRSSVATQTSIKDTIIEMNQHFETKEYGGNLVNTKKYPLSTIHLNFRTC